MIINAENKIVGRLATVAAKKALLGEEVAVVNCEKAVFSGAKKKILLDYERKISMGVHTKGPFFHKIPYKIVRRVIRGMLPHRQPKGRDAFMRIKCYDNVPKEFQGKEMVDMEKASVSKLKNYKYVYVGELCRILRGGK